MRIITIVGKGAAWTVALIIFVLFWVGEMMWKCLLCDGPTISSRSGKPACIYGPGGEYREAWPADRNPYSESNAGVP